jgi:hypothetical protein
MPLSHRRASPKIFPTEFPRTLPAAVIASRVRSLSADILADHQRDSYSGFAGLAALREPRAAERLEGCSLLFGNNGLLVITA